MSSTLGCKWATKQIFSGGKKMILQACKCVCKCHFSLVRCWCCLYSSRTLTMHCLLITWRLQYMFVYFAWILKSSLWTRRTQVLHFVMRLPSTSLRICKTLWQCTALVSCSRQCNNGTVAACKYLSIKLRHIPAPPVGWGGEKQFDIFKKRPFFLTIHFTKSND